MSLQSDIAGIHPIPFEESRLKASLLSLDSVFGIYPTLAWIGHTKTSASSSNIAGPQATNLCFRSSSGRL